MVDAIKAEFTRFPVEKPRWNVVEIVEDAINDLIFFKQT
jgi:hypothetical protein